MIYCEGEYCSIKDQCAYHELFECKHLRQYIDESTQGCAYGGFDREGKHHSFHHEYYCGDRAEWYKHYKALGWREDKEYVNSKGTICDEVCLTCEHQELCFKVLEYAGMTIQPGDRVRFDCEKIKENPEHYKKMVGRK
jgi:hypothetical protein